jgi:hypothetical protein
LALIAEKYGIDLRSVQVLPLQSMPNVISAVTGSAASRPVSARDNYFEKIEEFADIMGN